MTKSGPAAPVAASTQRCLSGGSVSWGPGRMAGGIHALGGGGIA